MVAKFVYALAIFTYVAAFVSIWLGVYVPELPVWIVVFLILFVFAWLFLRGIGQMRSGKKITAEVLPVSSMTKEEIKATFKCEVAEKDARKLCIAKYEIDGTIQRAMLQVKKMIGLIPGNNIMLYVVTHKIGIKKEYQVFTKWNIILDYLLGIPFVIAIIGWIFLFVMRGL